MIRWNPTEAEILGDVVDDGTDWTAVLEKADWHEHDSIGGSEFTVGIITIYAHRNEDQGYYIRLNWGADRDVTALCDGFVEMMEVIDVLKKWQSLKAVEAPSSLCQAEGWSAKFELRSGGHGKKMPVVVWGVKNGDVIGFVQGSYGLESVDDYARGYGVKTTDGWDGYRFKGYVEG